MTSFRIRPRFKVASEKDSDTIIEEIKEKVHDPKMHCACDVIFIPGHIILKIKKEEQHYWSPQLELTLEEEEKEKGTLIKGRYGPHHNVWTLFIVLYLAIGILTLFVSILGFSRLSLGMNAPILWIVPFLFGFALLLYISSQLGQKLGAEQTFTLHHFLEELIDRKIHIG